MRDSRVYAPASARVRKDAMPWDAEILESASHHERTPQAPRTDAAPTARIRKDAMPWDADILESAARH